MSFARSFHGFGGGFLPPRAPSHQADSDRSPNGRNGRTSTQSADGWSSGMPNAVGGGGGMKTPCPALPPRCD